MSPADQQSWNIQTQLAKLQSFTMADELTAMAQARSDVVVLTADLAFSNGMTMFAQQYPDRFFNVGIAEQNMMSIAAGLAASGFIPFVSTFASFASLLCAEHLRTDLAYTRMPVRVLAHHAGVAMGFYGTSHHAVEDLALTRAISHLTVVSAADGNAIRGLLRATLDIPGPVYLRLGRGAEKTVYQEVPVFAPGCFIKLREGTAATVIATGIAVRAALDAAAVLAGEGIEIRVLDAAWIKPIDSDSIIAAARETGGILAVEEHNPHGGLGGAVAEVIAEAGFATRFRRHSLPDDYALVAPPTHLYRYYELNGEGVANAVHSLLA